MPDSLKTRALLIGIDKRADGLAGDVREVRALVHGLYGFTIAGFGTVLAVMARGFHWIGG